jgi:hypothetical protein
MFFQKTKKAAVSFLLSLFVFSSVAGFLFSASPVNAQLSTVVAGDIPAQAQGIFDMIKNGWKIAVLNAAQQAVSYFLRKVAYDSAVWLASGGKGQSPFADTKGFGDYMASVGSDAAGTAIEQLGKGFGLDLCKIPDVKLDLALRVGLHYNYALGSEPNKPACNLSTFKENWSGDAWASKYGDGKGGFDPGKVFNSSLTIQDTDLGVTLNTTEKIDRLVAHQTRSAQADRIEGQGYKAATNLISGNIKTPSQVIKKESEANTPSEQNKKSEAQIAAAMGSGAYEIIPSTLSLFLNTLSAQMLKNFKENGMLPGGLCIGSYGDPSCKNKGSQAQNFDSGSGPVSGRAAAEAVFSDFLTTKIDVLNDYDILAQLNSCDSHGLYNCRADQGLVQAIQEAKHGTPVTIKEAMKKGWLHSGAKLIPPSRAADNADPNCYNDPSRYCYSNLAVLRQLRILPLGLEIAAKNSDPDHPWTLEEVVNGFYDCSYNKDGSVNYDGENKPFCHLVDPNWVIQLSQTRCDAKASGPSPLSGDVPDRISECVDVKTCVGKDKDGNCAGFGYCVREKNIWRFDADKCEAQFATCRSFTDSDNKQVAYLYRTLDTGECNQNTAGCQPYSLEQDDKGQWKDVVATDYGNYSTGIYLNKNVSTACSANSQGCSAFTLPGGGNTVARLKKAPDYLNCYDTDANAVNGITWPKTFSDIFKMKPNEQCKNFAQVCIADEVGCALYQPADDFKADQIPGKFTPALVENNVVTKWNDQCDSRCAGYAAYREMPTDYSAGNALSYIVPPSKYNQNQSGQICTAAEVGCNSFTNLSTTEGGGEKVEYFTNLRSCIKPDTNKQKNYYTYEGSVATGGYQLQVYTLQKDELNGGPKYDFPTAAEQTDAETFKCNADLYKAGSADADCRQFNDEKGTIYYRLLSHTIVVSDDCTPYRLNSSELAGVEKCFGTGEYKDGSCIYNGLPGGIVTSAGSSNACSAAAVSCREYKGNSGNNIKTVFNDNFEIQTSVTAANGWGVTAGSIAWSTESTKAGEHSLGYAGQGTLAKSINLQADSLDLQSDMSYSLSFWAKGTGANIDISVTDGKNKTVSAGKISVNNTWQYFKFNLIELQSVGTSTINFKFSGVNNLFLDNVRLTKVTNFVYLVKDSLKVDPVCDDNLNDNLPGAALGCTAYSGPQNSLGNTLYFLTNFSFLCREGAIGCTAFKDTFNTISDTGPRAYNVRLSGTTGTKVTAQVGSDSYTCQIEQGKTSCFVNIKGHTKAEIEKAAGAKAEFVNSTYFIPADTAADNPIYLVANEAASCSESDLGCTAAGLQKSTPSGNKFETVNIKLDPNQFETGPDASGNPQSGILCQKEAVGCVEYSSSQGSSYFKDPAVTGAKICTYKTGVVMNNTKVDGWFWNGVGTCANNANKNCSADDDCTVGGVTSTCENIDITPCYPDYLQNGNNYGLWSYGDKDKYKNFVGECPATQDACTLFVDHADNDQVYPFIKNNKITEGDCSGMASQKAGCALFDQIDNPNKYWNTAATYALSDTYIPSKGANLSAATKVKPIDSQGKNDANIIIKVNRDRECSEWLLPVLSSSVYDTHNSQWKKVSYRVGLCSALSNATNNNLSNCGNFVDENDQNSINGVLGVEDYVQRDIAWKGNDWSGYSVLGQYISSQISQVNIGTESKPQWTLGRKINCGGAASCDPKNPDDTACLLSDKMTACGKNNSGSCINGQCLQNINGQPFGNVDLEARKQICRAYPETNAPFPDLEGVKISSEFKTVNKCSEGDNGSNAQLCECDYTKVNYGVNGFSRYFKFFNQMSPANSGLCIGGKNDNQFCDSATTSTCPDGNCQKFTSQSQLVGWRGYCLEEDKSRSLFGYKDLHPCLTWFPVDALTGAKDINYQHKDAGFVPPVNGAYCYKGNLFARPTVFQASCPAGYYHPAGEATKCISTFAIPYDPIKFFGTYSNKSADFEISCEKPVVLDEMVIAATDNIWKDSKSPQNLAGNFPLTPTVPYAITNKGIYKNTFTATEFKNNGLVGLPVCKKPPFNFKKAISDKNGSFSCDEYGDGYVLSGPQNGGSYNGWGFRNALDMDNVSNYKPLCTSDADCATSQMTTENAGYNSYCALECSDDKECGVGGKCVSFGNVGLCNQPVPNTQYDYTVAKKYVIQSGKYVAVGPLMSTESAQKNGIYDPCKGDIGYTGIDGQTGIFFGYNYKPDRNNAVSVCQTANNGWGCIGEITPDKNYSDYSVPVLCYDVTKTHFEFATATTFVKGDNGSGVQNCGLNAKDVPKCIKKFPVGTTAGDYGIDQYIDKCSNQPIPKLVVMDESINNSILNSGESLKKLLVSVTGTYKWQFIPSQSGSLPTSGYLPDNPWDNTNNLSGDVGQSAAPVIHPVGENCILGDKCLEINTDGITINNVWNHDVWIQNKSETVEMKFYAWADKNHMPLRRLWLDWGDGTEKVEISEAYIRNYKGAVNSTCDKIKGKCVGYGEKNCVSDSDCQFLDQCLPLDQAKSFGSVVNLTCDNAFLDFTYSYKCSKDSPQYQAVCPVAEKDKINFPNGCCVYKPKVQVKDNWGWCNGTCDGQYGCYDGKKNKGCIADKFNSDLSNNHANTSFKGNILVVPIK